MYKNIQTDWSKVAILLASIACIFAAGVIWLAGSTHKISINETLEGIRFFGVLGAILLAVFMVVCYFKPHQRE